MSIDEIINLSDDQMSSQFQLQFPQGIPGGGSGENIVLRMEETFQVPRESVGEYEIKYMGMTVKRPNMTDETDKTVTIMVRLDQDWAVFDDLLNWKRMVHDPNNGTRLPLASVSTLVLVQALDGDRSVVKTTKLNNCVIKELEVTPFEHAGTEPNKVEMVLIVGSIDWE